MKDKEDDIEELHSDPSSPSGEPISTFLPDSSSGSTFYYAWCNSERRRIGGYTGDRTVAENAARNHQRSNGHSTSVLQKR